MKKLLAKSLAMLMAIVIVFQSGPLSIAVAAVEEPLKELTPTPTIAEEPLEPTTPAQDVDDLEPAALSDELVKGDVSDVEIKTTHTPEVLEDKELSKTAPVSDLVVNSSAMMMPGSATSVATTAGHFYFVAINNTALIGKPIKVEYIAGDTIAMALDKTAFTFVADEGHNITFVNDIAGDYKRATNSPVAGAIDRLDTTPEAISDKVLVFRSGVASLTVADNLTSLIETLIRHENSEESLRYSVSINLYNGILGELPNILASDGQLLARRALLNNAIDAAEGQYVGSRTPVKITLKHGAVPLAAADGSITFTNIYGTPATAVDGGELNLLAGNYTFEANIPALGKKATGSFSVEIPEDASSEQEFSLTFPDEEYWLSGISLGTANRVASITYNPLNGNVLAFPIFDNNSVTTAYVGVDWSAGAMGFAASNRSAVISYVANNATTPRNVTIAAAATVASPSASMTNFVPANGGSKEATLTVTLNDHDENVKFIQEYYIDVVRERTLSSLQIKQTTGDSPLSPEFAGTTYAYTVKVLEDNDEIEVLPTAFASYEHGYKVYVNDTLLAEGESATIPLKPAGETQDDINIQVRHDDGTASVNYVVTPELVPVSEHKVTIPRNATLEVRNSVGNIAEYTNHTRTATTETYTYDLITGVEYDYCATQDRYYSTQGKFIATTGGEELITIDTSDYLAMIAMSQSANSEVYAGFTEAEDANNEMSAVVADTANGAAGLRIGFKDEAVGTGRTITINYRWQTTMESNNGNMQTINSTGNKATFTSLSGMFASGGRGQNIDITVRQTDGAIIREQKYNIAITRQLSLRATPAPSFVYDGFMAAYTPAFNRDLYSDYEIMVPSSTRRLTVTAGQNGNILAEEIEKPYKLTMNGVTATKSDLYKTNLPLLESVVLLNGTDVNEQIEIELSNEEGGSGKYTFNVIKAKTVKMNFDINPKDAIFVLTDMANTRIIPSGDTYELMVGQTYKYSVSQAGYIGVAGEFVADSDITTMRFEIEAVAVNENINADMAVEWDKFRGDDNAGVTERMTPRTPEEAQLHWAYRSTGTSNIGQPLVLDDYVAIMAGNKLQYLDSISGELVAEGLMVGGAGVIATYAEGMIFTPQSGGRLQAFNATPRPQTDADVGYTNQDIMVLDSLWTYQDPRGGNGINPFFVENGYIYGSWNTTLAGFVCISITDEDISQTHEEKIPTWRWERGAGYYWAGAHVGEEFVVVGGESLSSNDMTSLNAKTGEVLDTIRNVFTSDNRGSVSYDKTTGRYCLVTRNAFYSVKLDENGKFYDLKSGSIGGSSTSTPAIYNGRAYIGYAGTGQFQSFTGSGIMVIDVESAQPVYVTRLQGNPQSSGLISSAYLDMPHFNPETGQEETGFVYVYFTENAHPGSISYIIDKPGLTKPALTTTVAGVEVAPRLFEPKGNHAQYNLASLQVDKYGTLFMKTDNYYIMAIGQKIESLLVKELPNKSIYLPGEDFDQTGMNVVLKFANGQEREIGDYVTVDDALLVTGQTSINVVYPYALYNNLTPNDFIDSNPNSTFDKIIRPTVSVPIVVMSDMQNWAVNEVITKIDDIGVVAYTEAIDTKIKVARAAYNSLDPILRPAITNYQVLQDAEMRYQLLELAANNKLPAIQVLEDTSRINVSTDGALNLISDKQKLLEAITLSIDELLAIENGENINITIATKVVEKLSAAEELLLNSLLDERELESSGYIIEVIFTKQVGNGAKTIVDNLFETTKVALDIAIPEEHQEAERIFYMINLHNNGTQVLRNENIDSDSHIRISSGTFAKYVFAYPVFDIADNDSSNNNDDSGDTNNNLDNDDSNNGNNNSGDNGSNNTNDSNNGNNNSGDNDSNNTNNSNNGNNNSGNNDSNNTNNSNNGDNNSGNNDSNNTNNSNNGNNNAGNNDSNNTNNSNNGDNNSGNNDSNNTNNSNNGNNNSGNNGSNNTNNSGNGNNYQSTGNNNNRSANTNNENQATQNSRETGTSATATSQDVAEAGEELEDMSATNEITQARTMSTNGRSIDEADVLEPSANGRNSNSVLTIILWGTGLAAVATAVTAVAMYLIKKKKKIVS